MKERWGNYYVKIRAGSRSWSGWGRCWEGWWALNVTEGVQQLVREELAKVGSAHAIQKNSEKLWCPSNYQERTEGNGLYGRSGKEPVGGEKDRDGISRVLPTPMRAHSCLVEGGKVSVLARGW